MPCSSSQGMGDSTDYDARRRLDMVEAMLCGILRLFDGAGALGTVLKKLDYAKMGVTEDEIRGWFARHLKRDIAKEDVASALVAEASSRSPSPTRDLLERGAEEIMRLRAELDRAKKAAKP